MPSSHLSRRLLAHLGRDGLAGAMLTAAAYFAVIWGLYDQVLRSPWNDPVIGRFIPLIPMR